MAGMAQSAVDSLLGRLSALLVDEAQLLRSVRGDVRFIRDEMESMNSLLAHLTEAQHRAHHVRTWMKQVVGLARDSEAYVELFARHVGGDPRAADDGQLMLMGFLRRMLWFLRTVPARHRVATQIRELKVQVCDVGERRLRYGVTVPSSAAEQGQAGGGALTLFDDDGDGNGDQLRTRDIWAS